MFVCLEEKLRTQSSRTSVEAIRNPIIAWSGCGRPHSYRESSQKQGAASCKVRHRARESAKCKAHLKGKPREEGPRSARRQKGEEAKRRPSHIGRAILRQTAGLSKVLSGMPGTRRSGVARSNNCPFPNGARLNTGFPTPFLRSLMQRNGDRTLSAGTMKVPVSSPSGKILVTKLSKEAQIVFGFPGLQGLGLADCDIGSADCQFRGGGAIILVSSHKVLAFSSRLEYESGGYATCFAMNPDGFALNMLYISRCY